MDTTIQAATGVGQGSDIGLLVHQRGSLIKTTEHLIAARQASNDQPVRSYLAIAATLTAHAAVESILNEWTYDVDRKLYEKTNAMPLVKRAEVIFGAYGLQPPADLAALSAARMRSDMRCLTRLAAATLVTG